MSTGSLSTTEQELLHRVTQPQSSESGWGFPARGEEGRVTTGLSPPSSPESASFVGRTWHHCVLPSVGSVLRLEFESP